METARLLAALSILLLRRLLRLAANPRIYYLLEVGKHIVCIDIPPSGGAHNKQLVGGTAPEPPKLRNYSAIHKGDIPFAILTESTI